MIVLVPQHVTAAIDRALDAKLKDWPDHTERDRAVLHKEILTWYYDHGEIPDFEIVKAMPV